MPYLTGEHRIDEINAHIVACSHTMLMWVLFAGRCPCSPCKRGTSIKGRLPWDHIISIHSYATNLSRSLVRS